MLLCLHPCKPGHAASTTSKAITSSSVCVSSLAMGCSSLLISAMAMRLPSSSSSSELGGWPASIQAWCPTSAARTSAVIMVRLLGENCLNHEAIATADDRHECERCSDDGHQPGRWEKGLEDRVLGCGQSALYSQVRRSGERGNAGRLSYSGGMPM